MPNSHYGNTFIEFASYKELIIEYENAHFRKIFIFASGEKEFIEDNLTLNSHNGYIIKFMKKILVVEDEFEIRQLLVNYLQNDGYEVAEAEDGINAIDVFGKDTFDLVILDILIPKIDGYGVCELIKKQSNVPIIFLSALSDEKSMVKGYDSLADDYVTKPFSMPVFLKKVKAVLRRNSSTSPEDYTKIVYKDVVMIPDMMKVYIGKKEIELTAREFDILLTLIKNPGRIYTREALLEKLWDYNALVDERIVDGHIKNLRHKIGEGIIETVRGRGYRVAQTDY